MIIKLTQTASNIKQYYDVEGEDFFFVGKIGSINRLQPIKMFNENTLIKGVFNFSKCINYIPFRWLLGKENHTKKFQVFKNENLYGSITFSRNGFMQSCYTITLESGNSFHCYCRTIGSFDYVSIYQGENQIALIETYLNTNSLKYTHKLYILDNYNQFSDIFSFFVLYYANFNFIERFHMSVGSFYVKSWSISRYNSKYNPKWREMNFPDENFFGKLNLFK